MKSVTSIPTLCILIVFSSCATPSTQIWIPSTDAQKFFNPHLGWDVYAGQDGTGMISNGGLTIGILPFEKLGMEVGVDFRDLSGDHVHPLYFNAKLGIPEDALFRFMPAAAIGLYDLGPVKGVNNYSLLYGLLAKTLWRLGRLSVGGYYSLGESTLMHDKKGNMERGGVLLSWDRTLSEISDRLWCAVDFQSGTNGYGAVSTGVSWLFAPNTGVIVGYNYYLNTEALPGTITLQFDLNLF
jgi:hypothetical protein